MWISWRMRWWSWMWFKQGQIEVEYGDDSDCGSGECGDKPRDGDAKGTSPAAIPLPNQSKPIASTLSFISL